ncbi:uncharacterized protein LOC106881413, partial [Octopus bimaculoides]|uniref:uncharacterized protein LOC106881413 n=1 Tax=Octopus bimaculoides TaxID=37653 RepID=UPI00071E3CB9
MGNFVNLVRELAEECSAEVSQWFKRRNNFLSDTIQNEILEAYAHNILHEIKLKVENSRFIGIICDGTTNCSGMEQVSITVWYVSEDLNVNEDFLGFYNPPDCSPKTLTKIILDVFCHLNISLGSKLCCFSFDGASTMSGNISGVQMRLKNLFPGTYFVHCGNHSLDLVLQEVTSKVIFVADALNFVHQCAILVKVSPKRKAQWTNLYGENVIMLQAVCPPQWCIRVTALKQAENNYKNIQNFLLDLLNDSSLRATTKATVKGLLKQSGKASILFGIKIAGDIFG